MAEHGSREVAWFEVHQYVGQLVAVASWPTAGTPDWCALDDDDPRKLAAVLYGGVHWALRLDTLGQELSQASREIAQSADWAALSRTIHRRNQSHIPRRIA